MGEIFTIEKKVSLKKNGDFKLEPRAYRKYVIQIHYTEGPNEPV